MHKNALLSTFGQANQLNKLMMRFFIYAIAQKGANASLKATGSSSLHLKGRCTINGGGSPKISSNKMTHKGFLPAFQVSMLLMNLCIDGTPGGFSQPTEDDNMRCQRVTQVCHLIGGVYKRRAICCRSSCKCFFQVWPFATVYFTFLAFQCCQMLSKKQQWQWPLTFKKKTASQRTGQHRNQICKTRHARKFASLKLVQLAPRSFCHAVDGIRLHSWRFRDTRLQCFRCSRTSPAAWPGSPLWSLKTSTNWWKATSENCTRPLQSMSFTKFFLSPVSMLIKVWPRAAIAALGTCHARSRSSCSSC